ncbi:hypothetical protein DRW03_27575 [Corallococcus sp. H22C18031201]|uniref:hypothetical protein n=1 Tax=Citreicoccus inhibens TaxID=2849499 RepID=UPI000E70AEF1|nr:hypothetical protein [Citreicoccus inhibens]MBU8896365.1 hypothetical protein [Citreicoccus inhibens]RJS17316.1 hypothetical protein DRW03_27575 [Corallococcus sp. H22C18031201]
MRFVSMLAVAVVCLLSGCAARQGGLEYPEREAIYDRPLEEVWPSVQQYFTDAGLHFRQDKGSYVLVTDWRAEFGGSKVAGFWHRYMVMGKRESPTQSKLWVIRVTRSANKTLSRAGKELDWGVNRAVTGRADDDFMGMADLEDRLEVPTGDTGISAESAQGQRDMVLEWKVYDAVAPKLVKKAEPAKPSGAAVAQATGTKVPRELTECGLPIAGLGRHVRAGNVLLLGELHGTQEVPRFIAQAACQVASAGVKVSVGLELPVENEGRMETFLASQGEEEDWLNLMDAGFWRSPYPDGRGSEAVANMLEQLRLLRAQGLDVKVFVYDHPKLNGQAREDALTATVMERVKHDADRFHLVVSGNVHSRREAGLPWDESYRPMGLLLKEKLKGVVSLDMAYDSGTAWICAVDHSGVKDKLACGVQDAKGKDNGARPFVHVWGGANAAGYDGVFYVGKVSASAPAVMRGLGKPGADDNSNLPTSGQSSVAAIIGH